MKKGWGQYGAHRARHGPLQHTSSGLILTGLPLGLWELLGVGALTCPRRRVSAPPRVGW